MAHLQKNKIFIVSEKEQFNDQFIPSVNEQIKKIPLSFK